MSWANEKLCIYPFVKYNDWDFFRNPNIATDAEQRFKSIKHIKLQDGDVFLCTPAKTGTHWMHEIMSMLLSQTTDYNAYGTIIEKMLEIMDFEELESTAGPRLFVTHLPFSFLPSELKIKGGKIIYLNRNPKDRHVSLYIWLQGKNGVPTWTWSEYFDKLVLQDHLYSGWFNHTKEIYDAAKNTSVNILNMMYEDLILDPKKCVLQIAQFLDVACNEDFAESIENKCSLNELSNHKTDTSKFIDQQGRSTIFRKGVIGDWKNWFTVAQNQQFDEIYKREMQGVDLNFIYDC